MDRLGIAIIIIVVSLLIRYLVATSKKEPSLDETGFMILKMHRAYGIIGYIGIGFSFLTGIVASLGTVKTNEDLLIVISLVVFFLLISVPLVLMSRNAKVEFDEEIIRNFGITGKETEIQWDEIKKVKFSKVMLELFLMTEKEKIKVHLNYIGFPKFVDLMKQRINYSLYKDVLCEIKSVYKKFE